MFFRLSLGAALIAATYPSLFMTIGLNIFKRIEERRPGAMACKPAIATVTALIMAVIIGKRISARYFAAGEWLDCDLALARTDAA